MIRANQPPVGLADKHHSIKAIKAHAGFIIEA